LLIARSAFDLELDPLHGQERQRRFWDKRFARGPTLEGKPSRQAAQCPAFQGRVRKSDEDHGPMVGRGAGAFKGRRSIAADSL